MANDDEHKIGDLLASAQRRLAASENPSLDAQVLLAHVMDVEKAWLLAHSEATLDAQQQAAWEAGLARLEGGEPLAYILGEWEFYGLQLRVTPDVLIPRPETELLVEAAQTWLAAHPQRRLAADIGTGSGCIPVALAMNVPDLHMVAGDVSEAALDVARINVERYWLRERVHLVLSDLMESIPGPFSLITANLPYIPSERLAELAVSKYEPMVALGGGEDGLRLIGPFLEQAGQKLSAGGLLLAEIDASLEAAVATLARKHWPKANIEIRKDLSGKPRLLVVDTSHS